MDKESERDMFLPSGEIQMCWKVGGVIAVGSANSFYFGWPKIFLQQIAQN